VRQRDLQLRILCLLRGHLQELRLVCGQRVVHRDHAGDAPILCILLRNPAYTSAPCTAACWFQRMDIIAGIHKIGVGMSKESGRLHGPCNGRYKPLLCCTASRLAQTVSTSSCLGDGAACLQLMAELSFEGVRRRSEAAGALGALLGAQLRQVGQGTPRSMVPGRPVATHLGIQGPCSRQCMGCELANIVLTAKGACDGAEHTCNRLHGVQSTALRMTYHPRLPFRPSLCIPAED
jgi:hypothetical protein